MNDFLLERLRFCTTLPTPPAIAVQLIELVNDPDSSLPQLAECIAYDPALSAKILKAANSPLYSPRRIANNLRQAVSMLGTHASITIALSFSLMRNMNSDGAARALWKRAVLSALACRILAQRFDLNEDDLLLGGLLQDIGILALRAIAPQEYAPLQAITDHDVLLNMERETFGAGHDEVGYWLLRQWRLPESLAQACIAKPTSESAPPTSFTCIAASGYFADVFLRDGNASDMERVKEVAQNWLGLDADTTFSVVEQMRTHLHDFESLFDLSITQDSQLDALLEGAKELTTIANLGLLHGLEEKAQRDALTGAHNRLYFDDAFKHEFAASTRHEWPFSVAFIDIDNFKRVNDTYGHAVGDNALVTLSRLIASQIRGSDIFARYGGEEFVLLFPGTTAAAAKAVLLRIKEAVASFLHTCGTYTFHLTISAGMACHMDKNIKYETAEEMLHAADVALYAAKHSGRNQIVIASA